MVRAPTHVARGQVLDSASDVVQFVVGSHPCSESFSLGTPVFSSPPKPTSLDSNSIWTEWKKSHLVDVTLLIPI